MNIPSELKYSNDHEWVKVLPDGTVEIGLTDYAQDALGDVVFVNLPEEGDALSAGDVLGDVESVKAVSDVLCPVGGTVSEVNEAILDSPESINKAPYEAWFIRLKDAEGVDDLMDAAAYEEFLGTL
ncbi:MAG: glycine cleavage system protein GcvH [Eubacteriales bacterium]|nr:glycine cleavage system protein GcvH [Eubacteriales bacterium]